MTDQRSTSSLAMC